MINSKKEFNDLMERIEAFEREFIQYKSKLIAKNFILKKLEYNYKLVNNIVSNRLVFGLFESKINNEINTTNNSL